MTNPLLAVRRFVVQELIWETPNTFSLTVKPADGETIPSFQAGQWVYLHLLNADGMSAGRAAFSIASAPEESAAALSFGIKVYGKITTALSQLKIGNAIGVQGPFGVFTLQDASVPTAFFAGGIGVSPLLSMIRSLAHKKNPAPVTLFYSNKRREHVAYFDELVKLANEWPAFRIVFTLTEQAPSNWTHETGRINEAMFAKHFAHADRGHFFVCGPAGFMDAVKAILEARGVDVKKRLKKESFG